MIAVAFLTIPDSAILKISYIFSTNLAFMPMSQGLDTISGMLLAYAVSVHLVEYNLLIF